MYVCINAAVLHLLTHTCDIVTMLRTAGVTASEPTYVMLSMPAACMAWMKREASWVWQKSTTTSAPLRRRNLWPLYFARR